MTDIACKAVPCVCTKGRVRDRRTDASARITVANARQRPGEALVQHKTPWTCEPSNRAGTSTRHRGMLYHLTARQGWMTAGRHILRGARRGYRPHPTRSAATASRNDGRGPTAHPVLLPSGLFPHERHSILLTDRTATPPALISSPAPPAPWPLNTPASRDQLA